MDESVTALQSSTDNRDARTKYGLLLAALLVALWLGVSWMYGWFPFNGGQTSLDEMREAATATSATAEYTPEMLKAATAGGPSQLTAEAEAALVEEATAP